MDIRLNKEELTQKLLSYKEKIECGFLCIGKSETEYNSLDNHLLEMYFDGKLNITKFDDGNIRICDEGESTFIIEMDRFRDAEESTKYDRYFFVKPHRAIAIELTNGNIIYLFFRDVEGDK